MLSGTAAFEGESSIDRLHATLRTEPRDLGTLTDVPVALTRLVERCLEKDPAERMQSARDLVFSLDTITADDAAAGSAATRHGLGGEATVGIAPPAVRRRVVIGGLVAAGVIAATLVGWFALRGRSTPAMPPTPSARDARHGIAVLPFENLAAADQAYFAAGVTDEVTVQIAKMSALRVMSRAAVTRFKEPTSELAAMSRELGIGAVLTGSVRHADGRVRVAGTAARRAERRNAVERAVRRRHQERSRSAEHRRPACRAGAAGLAHPGRARANRAAADR